MSIICPLCGKEVDKLHKKSHIFPEFILRESPIAINKDETVYLGKPKQMKKKKTGLFGIEIICKECEKETAQYDSYLADIFKEGRQSTNNIYKTTISDKIHNKKYGEKWSGLQGTTFYKAILSIILRYYLFCIKEKNSRSPNDRRLLSTPILNDKYFKQVKEEYFKNKIQKFQFPILLSKIIDTESDAKLNKIVLYPCMKKFLSHKSVNFEFLGYGFTIFVSSHSKKDLLEIKDCFLTIKGNCTLPYQHISHNKLTMLASMF